MQLLHNGGCPTQCGFHMHFFTIPAHLFPNQCNVCSRLAMFYHAASHSASSCAGCRPVHGGTTPDQGCTFIKPFILVSDEKRTKRKLCYMQHKIAFNVKRAVHAHMATFNFPEGRMFAFASTPLFLDDTLLVQGLVGNWTEWQLWQWV